MFDVDLFVIGGGSGGVRAARVAAEHGARVAIAEDSRWGGTCVIRGCVPKKLLVYASEVSRTLEDAAGNGWTIGASRFDWPTLIAAKDREITRLSQAYTTRLTKAGAQLFEGRAHIADPHTIDIAGRRVTAANILVATGSRPRRPAGPWISSDEAFDLAALPERVVILGGGYIGVEFAHIFAGFGAKVAIVHRLAHVLRGFDQDLRAEVQRGFAGHGIESICGEILGTTATSVTVGEHGTPGRVIPADLMMAAVGRDPATEDLGLAEAGVTLGERGKVVVDEYSRSNVPHIFAVGDVTARATLTPIAIREGHAVADTLFGNRPTAIKHHLIPTAVFSQPPAAAIGCTEHDTAHRDVQIFRARFKPMRYALSGRDEHVFIKLIVDRPTDRVLGLHVVGPDAPEIVQSAAIAITMGATKADLDRTFALHPTTAEELVLMR